MVEETKKKGPTTKLIGYFDKKTRLVSSASSFTIQVCDSGKSGEVWKSIYFYTWIGDAIRGYAKYMARRSGKEISTSRDLSSLLDAVASLERTIKKVGSDIASQWEERQEDPVEQAIAEEEVHDEEEDLIGEDNDE